MNRSLIATPAMPTAKKLLGTLRLVLHKPVQQALNHVERKGVNQGFHVAAAIRKTGTCGRGADKTGGEGAASTFKN